MSRPEDFTDAQKREIRERADHRCEECGAPARDCDHIHCQALGGAGDLDNGQLLCDRCHQSKTAEDVRAWRKALRLSGEINPKTGEPYRCQSNRNNRYRNRLRSRGFPKARDE